MKKSLVVFAALAILVSCHESIEKRAAREAREYTEKFCPTPVVNFVRTDSTTFDIATKTYSYHCSVVDEMDDEALMKKNYDNLKNGLLANIKENTELRIYKEAGFSFAYILHSGKNPTKTLFQATFSPKDYAQ